MGSMTLYCTNKQTIPLDLMGQMNSGFTLKIIAELQTEMLERLPVLAWPKR
jgi:hypothetical protein